MARPINDSEKEVFEAICNASNIALVNVQFDGEETAVIAAINEDNGEYDVIPLAVLVTDSIFSHLSDPTME